MINGEKKLIANTYEKAFLLMKQRKKTQKIVLQIHHCL